MRGNSKNRKGIDGGVKVVYEIVGLNQDRLIAELKKRDFTLFDVKKLSNRVMHISVNLSQSENFFAITENLCYNIKKLSLKGKGLPLYKLLRNFGLALGALCFLILAVISNDYILDFSYSGSGSVYSRQVSSYLKERGVTKFSRFSDFETQKLEDEILANNPNLTFVSATKKGNTLALYLTLKKDGASAVSGRAEELRASCDGVVESVKVYRGTALVKAGDSVKSGDLLVEGYAEIKEERVKTGALAFVTLLEEKTFIYRLSKEEGEAVALALAGEELPQSEIVKSYVVAREISGDKERLEYAVTATYRRVLYAE